MPTIPSAIQQFRAYVQRRHDSPHTLDRYTQDLQVFFAASDQPLERISFREVDRCIDAQHQQGLSPATINRRTRVPSRPPLSSRCRSPRCLRA